MTNHKAKNTSCASSKYTMLAAVLVSLVPVMTRATPLSSNLITISGIHWKESVYPDTTVTESGVKLGYQTQLLAIPNNIRLMQNIEGWVTRYSGYNAELNRPAEGTGIHLVGDWAILHNTPTNPSIISGIGYSARMRKIDTNVASSAERVFQSEAITGFEWGLNDGSRHSIIVEVPMGTDLKTQYGVIHPKAKPSFKVVSSIPVSKQSAISITGSYQRWDASDRKQVSINGSPRYIWQPKTEIGTLGIQFRAVF